MPQLGKKILVVDDDAFQLATYANKFRAEGFEVKTARDGQEAWETMLGGYTPDLLFTGVLMPRLGGFDLLRNLRLDPRFALVHVVVFSRRGEQEDREMAILLGADDFIVQGVVPLVEVVRRVKLILGVQQKKYVIPLVQHENDGEALLNFLNKQQQTTFGLDQTKKVFLEIEPRKETGDFGITLTDEKPK